MTYSLSFKESHIRKVLPPENQSISQVAKEAGLSYNTLKNWITKSKEGTLDKGNTVGNRSKPPREKLQLIIESKTISEKDMGRWLREKGLHFEHIILYEQELRDMVEDKKHDEKMEIKKLTKEIKRLNRELLKKEKALAEMAALYILKKKADELWGEDEDD